MAIPDYETLMLPLLKVIWLRKCGQVLVYDWSFGWGKQGVFKFDWGEITQRGMEPRGVVKGLNVIKEHGLSMLEVERDLVVEALGFKGRPEAFHYGVIVTASLPAHAGKDLVEVQKLSEGA